jgi:hypothetical protein
MNFEMIFRLEMIDPKFYEGESPPLHRPAASQERSRKAIAPACCGRDDKWWTWLKGKGSF